MRWLFFVGLLYASGCGDHEGDLPDLAVVADLAVADDLAPPPDLRAPRDLALRNSDAGLFVPHDKVDILFMVDNSPSMTPKQMLLHQGFPSFVAALQAAAGAHPASYHIGVITDDLGAGPFTLNQGQCQPNGMGGKLQAHASAGDPSTPAACAALTLGGGVNFIDYDQIHGTDNLGGVDVATAFTCVSSVGASGCGFEHPLEATYKALHDPIVENTGFLRSDALLVVVYVTDEDDCSAPATSDLFDPSTNGVNMWGTLHSFRCTQWGIACGTPAMQVGNVGANLSMCRPWTVAEGSQLIDVQKYIDYFGRAGGVKADASDVILASIAAPVPQTISTTVTMPCADQVNTPSCAILDHSCVQTGNANVYGDPPIRLFSVVSAAATSHFGSACDTDYAPALGAIAQKIIDRLP